MIFIPGPFCRHSGKCHPAIHSWEGSCGVTLLMIWTLSNVTGSILSNPAVAVLRKNKMQTTNF
jgi:hypothetical protein